MSDILVHLQQLNTLALGDGSEVDGSSKQLSWSQWRLTLIGQHRFDYILKKIVNPPLLNTFPLSLEDNINIYAIVQ